MIQARPGATETLKPSPGETCRFVLGDPNTPFPMNDEKYCAQSSAAYLRSPFTELKKLDFSAIKESTSI